MSKCRRIQYGLNWQRTSDHRLTMQTARILLEYKCLAPASVNESRLSAESQIKGDKVVCNQALILLEDEEYRRDAARILESEGLRPTAFDSLDRALTFAQVADVATIVLDVKLAKDQLHDELDKFAKSAPNAIILTACSTGDRTAIEQTLAKRRCDYILKPIHAGELLARLERFHQQRRVDSQLKDSLSFIKRVADASPELLYLFDVKDGASHYVNRQVCATFGCTPEGLSPVGFMFFASVIHPDDREHVSKTLQQAFRSARDDDVIQSEYRVCEASGRWRWVHCREIVFQRDENGQPQQILGAAQDISVRKILDETRAQLASIVESTDDGVIGKTLDGEIVNWNAAAERIYGYTASEAIGQNISMLVPGVYRNEIPDILNQIRNGQHVDHYRTIRQCKDGRQINVSITVSPIRNGDGEITGASSIVRVLSNELESTRVPPANTQ